MRGIVCVQAGLAEGNDLRHWIDLAAEFVSGLSAK